MKIHVFILLMLVLTVSAGRRRYRGRMTMPPPEGGCAMVQPFEHDFVYTYKYIAYTEHRDMAMSSGNDVRITCTAMITIPRRCSGKLRVSDCQLDEGKLATDGTMSYRPLPSSSEFAREMEVGEMAFHFNGGQITRIFVDKQERTNVTNFKRGILSSLQAYYPEMARGVDVGEVIEVPEISVYGQGYVKHKILEKSGPLPSVVEVIRDTSKIELPWERRQWNFIRMRKSNTNPLLSAFYNYITLTNEERWAKSMQRCRYELKRGRLVAMASCEERFPLNPMRPEFAVSMFDATPIETVIRQELFMKAPRRMTQADRSQWDTTRFDEESIMFEEEWEETNVAYTTGFDAEAAFMKLVRESADDKSPALLSKLSRWLAVSSQERIEGVWAKCERECSEKEKADGRILWVELLDSCISNDLCQIPYCPTENATTCQRAMDMFVINNHDKSPEVREACLSSLEYIRSPSVQIIQTTLTMCRSDDTTSPECVRTLGMLLKNFFETCGNDCENKKPIEDAKLFLVRQLKKNCETRNEELEDVMMVSLEIIGMLGSFGKYAEDTVLKCAVNMDAPASVAIRALVAYENITEETLPTKGLNKLVEMFMDPEGKLETRITCFHLLMKKSLPLATLERILTAVMDDTEHPMLIEHCRDDIRTQMMLRGTMFCQINPMVAENCVKLIIRNRWNIGIPLEDLRDKPVEKENSMMREMFLPYFDVKTNCTIKMTSVYEKRSSLFPIMVKLDVYAMVEGRNMSILETAVDFAGMKPVLDRIFGHNHFYAELFGKLLRMPVRQLHGYSRQYPALNKLMEDGKYDYMRNIFKIRSPIYLNVLGYEISFDSLMSMDMFRRMTVSSIMEMIYGLEKGFEHKAFVVGQPFLMQHATPTCIGAPITSTIEMSYILKNALSFKASLRRMFFSPNEKAVAKVAPELFLTGSVRRTILEKFTTASGTELNFNLGHASAVDCTIDSTPNGWSMTCTPKEGKSRLFHLSGKRSLTGIYAREPAASMCQAYSLRSMCTFTFCKQPAGESGFAYEMDFDNHFDTEFTAIMEFQARPEEPSREMVKEFTFEWTAERRSNPSTKKVLLSSVIGFVPSRKELECKIECEFFRWRGAASLMFPMHGSYRGMFASANSSGLEDLEFRYFNVFRVIPESDKRYMLEGESKWTVGEELRGYGLRGSMQEAPEGSNVTKMAELEIYHLNRERELLLRYEILMKKIPSGPERMQGYEVSTSLMGPMVPYYKKYEAEMITYDNGIQYDKVMRISGHFANAERNPHFFIHRIKGSMRQPEREAYRAEVYCVSNYFHWQFKADCDDKGDVVQRGKLNMPERMIAYDEIVRERNPFSYKVEAYTRPMASYIEYNFTSATMESEDRRYDAALSYRLWDFMYREYYAERAAMNYVNYRECSYCHAMELRHPKIYARSITRSNSERRIYREEKWVRIHHSLLRYMNIRPYISYYLINNLKNGYVEVGWKGMSAPSEGSGTKAELELAFLKNMANCSLEIMNEDHEIKSKCVVDTELIPLRAELHLDIKRLAQNTPEILVSCDAKYADIGCNVTGLFKLTRSNDFKCFFDASYGSYPKFEYEDKLNLSFDDVQSRYDILGAYQTIYKPTGVKKVYKYLGTSERLEGGKRDLEIKAMCPSESATVCAKFMLNKNGKMAEYERNVGDNRYDRVSVRYEDDMYYFETEMANEIFWGVKRAVLSMELRESSYGFGLESKICNMSYRYSDESGIEAKTFFRTKWLEYEMDAVVNSASARYGMVWNKLGFGGARIESNMTLNYVILNWDKRMDAAILMGSGPGSMRTYIKIPDFDFNFDYSVDRDRTPMRYKYFCDARIVPYNMLIKELRFPIFDRRMEVKNTRIGVEYRDEQLYEMFMRDVSIVMSPECKGLPPMTVSGNCGFSYERVLMKMASSDRAFVVDVDITPSTPMKHHIEFVLTMMRSKLEFLWDMNTINRKVTTVGKMELSMISQKTEEMTPVITMSMNNIFEATPEAGNFPVISINVIFSHALPVPFIPRENKLFLASTVSGMTTRMHYFIELGTARVMEMAMTMSGCHKRFTWRPEISMCIPNMVTSNYTYAIPSFRGEHIYTLTFENKEWVMATTYKLLVPTVSVNPFVTTANAKAVLMSCPTESWCLPERIEIKEMELVVPETFDILLRHFLPPMVYRYHFPGFHLERSGVIFSREFVGETSINTLFSTLRRRGNNDEIAATLTATFAPNKFAWVMDITCGDFRFKHELEESVADPTDIESPWKYHHLLESPWMTTNTDIKASSLLGITSCETKMVMPRGLIRDFTFSFANNKLTCNLELALGQAMGKAINVLSWNPESMEWRGNHVVNCPWMNMRLEAAGRGFTINSCDMNLDTVGFMKRLIVNFGDGNANFVYGVDSFEAMMKKRGSEYTCDLKSGRYPYLNQTLVVTREEEGNTMNYQTTHKTQYHRCICKFNMRGYRIGGKELDCRMNNAEAGIKIEYVVEGEERLCRITGRGYDNTKYYCMSTPMRNEFSEAKLVCSRVKGTTRTEFMKVPVTMKDFPFMGNYLIRDKALFLWRCAEHISKIINYDEKYLYEEYLKERWCTNEEVCRDIASRVKSSYYSCIREMKRLAGPRMYYATMPETAEYAMYEWMRSVPGGKMVLPDYTSMNKYSMVKWIKESISEREISLLHFAFGKYLRMEVSAKLDAEGNFMMMSDYSSQKYPWFKGFGSLGFGTIEGITVVNSTQVINGWRYVTVFALEGGKLNLIASEHGATGRDKSTIMTYSWGRSDRGRYNITMLMMKTGEVSFVCDLLTDPLSWSNTELECFEGRRREHLIGKLSVPDLSTWTYHDVANVDDILREVLHMESPMYRNKMKSQLHSLIDRSYFAKNSKSGMVYRSADYAIASLLHETTKYMANMDDWSFGWPSSFYDLSYRYFVEPLRRSIIETLRYSVEGDVTAEYKLENDALVVKLMLNSNRMPVLNFDTSMTFSRRSFGSIMMNMTTTNKFTRMYADAVLDGPRIALEKVGFALPDKSRQFIEFRLVSNRAISKPPIVEIYFADMEGQRYGCRGDRDSWESLMLHMHCYVLEGTELPVNPPSSKMFSHYDMPYGAPGPFAGMVLTVEMITRMINPCLEDPEVLLKETYHVYEAAIRQRLARTIEHNCHYWKDVFAGSEQRYYQRLPEVDSYRENSMEYFAKKYRSYSKERWVSSAKEAARRYMSPKAAELELGFFGDLIYTIYDLCYPSLRYFMAVAEYVKPEGLFKISRCAECEANDRELEILSSFKSRRFPALDQVHTADVSSAGMINVSVSNNCGWAWLESEVTGMMFVPRKAKFGTINNMEGVEVIIRPEVAEEEAPLMSFCFDATGRHCCDARMGSLFRVDLRCHTMVSGQRGAEVAICEMSPMKTYYAGAALVFEAVAGDVQRPQEVARALRRTCEFHDNAFKDAVSKSLSEDINFLGEYYRDIVKGVVKAIGELYRLTYSSWWNAMVDIYDWMYDLVPYMIEADIRRYMTATKDMIGSALHMLQNVALSVDIGNKMLYDAGYMINKLVYEFPSYIPLLWHSETEPHYYQTWSKYLRIMGNNLAGDNNCACGMIHGNDVEQVISLNNHLYNLPRRIRKCPYLLAADHPDQKFSVLLMRNDLVITLGDLTISIGPDMRVSEGRKGVNGRSEIPLPYFHKDMYCERTETRLTCFSKFMTVMVHCMNNVRTGFFIKFETMYCPRTKGLMGIGANSTEVPPMKLTNGEVATSLETFLNYYSADKSCDIGQIPPEPKESHEYCDAIFNNEQWINTCPMRRRSFMMACQMNARSSAEACKYAEKYGMMCHMEGRATEFPPACEICHGKEEMKSSIEKVQFTVIVSLSSKSTHETLPEIANAVRQMANQKRMDYEISFVTFGGRNYMYPPAFHALNGWAMMPASTEWTLPRLEFNGPVPEYEALRNAMWYAFMNTRTTVEGFGKVFLFVLPEDMDLAYLETTTIVNAMKEAMVEPYLLILRTCRMRGAKSGARFGVRPMFTTQPENICKTTALELASAIEYSYMGRSVDCMCKVANIFTGETLDECRPLS